VLFVWIWGLSHIIIAVRLHTPQWVWMLLNSIHCVGEAFIPSSSLCAVSLTGCYATSCLTQGHSTLAHCAWQAYWLLTTTVDHLLGLVVLMVEGPPMLSLTQGINNSHGWHFHRVSSIALPAHTFKCSLLRFLWQITKNSTFFLYKWHSKCVHNVYTMETLPLKAWKMLASVGSLDSELLLKAFKWQHRFLQKKKDDRQ